MARPTAGGRPSSPKSHAGAAHEAHDDSICIETVDTAPVTECAVSSNEDDAVNAADWLARIDRQDEPDRTAVQFEAWCRADPRNLAAYLQLLEVWNRLDALEWGAPRS